MHNAKEYFRAFTQDLTTVYNESEARAVTALLLEELLLIKPHHLAVTGRSLSAEELNMFNGILARLLNHEPVQYILGYVFFCGMKLKVTPDVLIPRPETEELAGLITGRCREKGGLRVLDIGTGSGCIAISLKKQLLSAQVTAMDVSAGALNIAQENALKQRTDIRFVQDDILLPAMFTDETFDIIVSNPPYIEPAEADEMHGNVLTWEPQEALFVTNEDPLQFYRAISAFGMQHLSAGGHLYFEINRAYGEEIKNMLSSEGYTDAECQDDMHGNARIVTAIKP